MKRKAENLKLVGLMHVGWGALTVAEIITFQCVRQDVPDALHLIAARFHRSVLIIWRGSPNATLGRKFLLKLIMQGHPIMRNPRKD